MLELFPEWLLQEKNCHIDSCFHAKNKLELTAHDPRVTWPLFNRPGVAEAVLYTASSLII